MSRKVDKGPPSEIIFLIDQKILCEQWSPEQISNWLKISNYEPVSHTWIYQYIEKDKSQGGELFNNLRRGSYSKGHKPYKGNIPDRISIEERPSIVNERMRLGDYEIDLIVSPKNKGAILSLIDRVSSAVFLRSLMESHLQKFQSKLLSYYNHPRALYLILLLIMEQNLPTIKIYLTS